MQLDFSREELTALKYLTSGAHPELYVRFMNASAVSRSVSGCFSWRTASGSPQVNTALVLVDGVIIDNVALADTDAGLVVRFDDEQIEGRVEVWMP